MDQLRNAHNFVRAVGDGAARHCTDAPSKAAVCKMKTLDVSRGASVDFKFAGGKGTATTDVSSYPSWDMIAAQPPDEPHGGSTPRTKPAPSRLTMLRPDFRQPLR